MKERVKQFIILIPLFAGIVGYMNGDSVNEPMNIVEAIYSSAALYFVNPISDISNTWVIVAKYGALFVTGALIIGAMKRVLSIFQDFSLARKPNSITIYGDDPTDLLVERKIKNCRYSTSGTIFGSKHHLIYHKDDMASLRFVDEHAKEFANKNVYLLLNELDEEILKANSSKLRIMNISDLVARFYWKENNLLSLRKCPIKIGIIGYGEIGKAIFRYGYLNNIYDLNQKIEYHIWGALKHEKVFLENLNFGNQDKVIIHDEDCLSEMDEILSMTRIICTYDNNIKILQEIIRNKKTATIHCYCETNADLAKYYDAPNLKCFGKSNAITYENIIMEKTYELAKLFCYDYKLGKNSTIEGDYLLKANEEWEQQTGFMKGSNIARADHYWIEKALEKEDKSISKEALWEMEHIRWCRYYYINGWSFAETRDNDNKKHHLLVEYSELDDSEKIKDGIINPMLKKVIDAMF